MDYTTEMVVYPLVPMRGINLFPGTVLHFDAGRERTVEALEQARKKDSMIFLTGQKEINV